MNIIVQIAPGLIFELKYYKGIMIRYESDLRRHSQVRSEAKTNKISNNSARKFPENDVLDIGVQCLNLLSAIGSCF